MLSVGNPVCIFHLQHISISTSHCAVLKGHMWLMAAILDSTEIEISTTGNSCSRMPGIWTEVGLYSLAMPLTLQHTRKSARDPAEMQHVAQQVCGRACV